MAMPCSVATKLCWKLVTGSMIRGRIVEQFALACHEGSTMNDRPPREWSAPTMKSVDPPKPEWVRPFTRRACACSKKATDSDHPGLTCNEPWVIRTLPAHVGPVLGNHRVNGAKKYLRNRKVPRGDDTRVFRQVPENLLDSLDVDDPH